MTWTELEFPLRTVAIYSPPTDPSLNEAQQMMICDRFMEKFSREDVKRRMVDMYLRGETTRDICNLVPCSTSTLYQTLRKMGIRKRNAEPNPPSKRKAA